jgi:hypothetical protein
MGTKEKIEAEIDKAKAKNQNTYEKANAEVNSDGLTKELKQTGSEIKKDIKIAAAEIKKKIN